MALFFICLTSCGSIPAKRNDQGQIFTSTVFIKDFLCERFVTPDLWLSDVWILSLVSLLSSFSFVSFFLCTSFFSFPSNIPGTFSLFTPASSPSALSDLALCWSQSFFQLPVSHTLSVNSLSPRSQIPPSVCLWSSQAAIWGLSLERCCWHNKQVTSWDTQKSTLDAVALSLCQRHKHTQLTSNTHTHINTHSEQQLSTHRCLHQKQFVSCTFCTSRHLHSNTYTDTHINALQLKIAYTLTSRPTQISISNILTVLFSFLFHTHTCSSPLTSCPRCQKHVVCFLCQQVHIPDRKPLYGVSVASKLNVGDFHGPNKALLCHLHYNM